MKCYQCGGPMDAKALKHHDSEDECPACSRCNWLEYAAECASLEAAESGTGLERLRSDAYELAHPWDLVD